MRRAAGGFDASYNAQTAVDEAAPIIVAGQLTNCASDAGELPTILRAVQENLGRLPTQVLTDAGYKSEAVFEAFAGTGCELVVALGREGKRAVNFDPERSPRTAATAVKLQSEAGRRSPAPQVDRRAAPRLDQERAGVPAVQLARPRTRPRRLEARLHGAELAANGCYSLKLMGLRCSECTRCGPRCQPPIASACRIAFGLPDKPVHRASESSGRRSAAQTPWRLQF